MSAYLNPDVRVESVKSKTERRVRQVDREAERGREEERERETKRRLSDRLIKRTQVLCGQRIVTP